MKLIFVYKVLPCVIIYTDWIKKGFAGMNIGPFVLIKPIYEDDVGLLAHELTHAEQFYRFGGFLFAGLYCFSKKWRLTFELEAYLVQLKCYDISRREELIERFAGYIAEKYDLPISKDEAIRLML